MIYDYKSNDYVQDVTVDDLYCIIEDIEDEFDTLRRDDHIYVYCPQHIAKAIVNAMVEDYDADIHEEADFYLLEEKGTDIVLTISCDGMMFIEESRLENGQMKCPFNSALTYFWDEYSQKDLMRMSEDCDSILVFGLENEMDEAEDEKDNSFTIAVGVNKPINETLLDDFVDLVYKTVAFF